MRTPALVLTLAMGLVLATTASAQIGSRCLPPQMPPLMAPPAVMNRPPMETQEVSVPLFQREKPATPGADGRPDAVALDAMCKEPREVIRLAEAGKFKEAVEAGRPLLALGREKYRDFTWDYLANAVAWSALQTGDLKAAIQAHGAVGGRIDDMAVAEYHRLAVAMLNQTKKSAAELKDPAVFQAEIRAGLADRIEALKTLATAAEKDRQAEPLLRHLKDGYEKLRALVAADPETGRKEPLAAFRKTAQGLATQVLPPLVADVQRMQQRLDDVSFHGYHNQGLRQADWPQWNGDVLALWGRVQEIKRLCRISDYLVRAGLADAGNAAGLCQQAHACLFTGRDGKLVWQKIGQPRMINTLAQLDMRLRVPYQETRITPWGIAFSGELAAPPGAKPMDPMTGQMQTMDGKMQQMDGKMQPMDGKMQPMDGQMPRMGGQMQPMQPAK
jgi:hypothetical protein